MSLWLMKTVAPCMAYIDNGSCSATTPPLWGPNGLTYNGYLITCPRHFKQGKGSISHFYYDPATDLLRAIIAYTTTYWPGWDAQRLDFSPETGAWVNRDEVLARQVFVGIWGTAWTGKATMGSYGLIYATDPVAKVNQIDPLTMNPAPGGWSIDPTKWSGHPIYSPVIVNRIDGILAGVSSWTLDCWRGMETANPEKFAQLRLPNVLGYMAYESRNYCWIITKDGVILKADYKIPRWEMISRVNSPEAESTGYAIAFDTRRKQVVVFRSRPDATDGTCQHQLEFYYPMVSPAQLTQPVPVTSLRAGKRVILVAHLIGEAGEGITPYTVNAALQEPVEGRLVTPFSGTELGGRVAFQYQAPDEACEETLRLETTVEETI